MGVFLPLPGNEKLAADLAELTAGTLGRLETRRFPDGETYLRVQSEIGGAEAWLVCTLARPDEKLLPLIFAAATARRLGSSRVRLIAPYLAYMRQDTVFQPGEALASRDFAALISSAFDGIFTVDPHLHRYRSLSELYSCETRVVHAAPAIADWIRRNVRRPLIVGPDAESEQWAAGIAAAAAAPHIVLGKERLGDREVRLSLPDLTPWRDFQPVIVDDIVSSGTTVVAAAQKLLEAGLPLPHCVAVHALFDEATRLRIGACTSTLVTTDTVANSTNGIALAEAIAQAL